MTKSLQTQQKRSMTDYFQEQVLQAVATMPDFVTTSEARRLTLNIVVAAQDSIEKTQRSKNPFAWSQKNIPDFITQMVKAVTAGLDASNDEVWVYPYGQKMTVSPSYRGYLKMVKEHSIGKEVKDMLVFVVREGETFSVKYGVHTDDWEYDSKMFNDAPPLGYVTVLVYEDGTCRVMEHTLMDIEKRKRANPMGESPAWKNWPVEMAIAKAIKRHARTVNLRLRPEIDKLADFADFEGIKDLPVIDMGDIEPLEVIPAEVEVEVIPKQTKRKKKETIDPIIPPAPEPPPEPAQEDLTAFMQSEAWLED